MAVINVELADTFNEWRVKINSLSDIVGDGATFDASFSADNLVDALNEIVNDATFNDIITIVDAASDNTTIIATDADNLELNGTLTVDSSTGDTTTTRDLIATRNVECVDVNASGDLGGATLSTTGDASVGDDLSVTGTTLLTSALYANGGIAVDTNKFVVADTTGNTSIAGTLGVNGSTTLFGSLTLNGSAALNGNITLGNATSDVVSFNSRVDTNILPSTDNTRDLGSSSLRWNELYAVTSNTTATAAQYADLAEKYLADAEYSVGTVIAVGGEAEVTAATVDTAHSVIGVVSENPALMMNSALEGGTYIALKGRVQVRVTGDVKKGDRLVASTEAGVAEANNAMGHWSFAVALEDKVGDTVEAVIL